jgi:hypothetical protein
MSSEPTPSYDDAGIVQLLSAYDSKGATGDAQNPASFPSQQLHGANSHSTLVAMRTGGDDLAGPADRGH